MNAVAATKPAAVERDHALTLLRQMLPIRRFEEKSAELYTLGKIRGVLHLYIGEEAVAVGAMQALTPEDNVVSTYREHGHALARGMSARAVMAEMYGKENGCSRGRGGSMHLFDARLRFYGGNAVVGGHLPMSVGLALADRMRGRPAVTAASSATEPRPRASSTRRSTSPRCGTSRAVPVREKPVRDGHAPHPPPGADRPAPQGRGLRHAGGGGGRHGRAGGRGGDAAGRRGRPLGGAFLPGGAHVPFPLPLDVRRRAVPHEGRGRGVEETSPDRDLFPAAAGVGLLGDFYDLDAPVARVCTAEVPIPYAGHLEDAALPRVETVVDAVRGMVGRHG